MDADMLRSVVLPLEEEITVLKTKLKDSKDYAENLRIKVAHHLHTVNVNSKDMLQDESNVFRQLLIFTPIDHLLVYLAVEEV